MEHARQPQFPDDGIAQARDRAFGQEAEVVEDDRPDFARSDLRRAEGHGDDGAEEDECKQGGEGEAGHVWV